jgi:hypothetical protein
VKAGRGCWPSTGKCFSATMNWFCTDDPDPDASVLEVRLCPLNGGIGGRLNGLERSDGCFCFCAVFGADGELISKPAMSVAMACWI